MTDISYFVEEKLHGRFRGFAATLLEDLAVFDITFDDLHVQISLDELNFIARAAGNLPAWIKDAEGVPGPTRTNSGKPEVKSTIKPKAQPAPPQPNASLEDAKAERHGKRWNEEEDKKLLRLYLDEQKDVGELTRLFGRSPGSIISRLWFLEAIVVTRKT